LLKIVPCTRYAHIYTEDKMHMHSGITGLVFSITIMTTLMFLLARPEISLGLWHRLSTLLERRRARRCAVARQALEDRLKKYHVIDMRKLR